MRETTVECSCGKVYKLTVDERARSEAKESSGNIPQQAQVAIALAKEFISDRKRHPEGMDTFPIMCFVEWCHRFYSEQRATVR